jgi:hypothetical protein
VQASGLDQPPQLVALDQRLILDHLLAAFGVGLDAVVRDVERLTLQQLAGSGRVDQRIQKVDLALRPIMRRLQLLVRGLRQHQTVRLNQR